MQSRDPNIYKKARIYACLTQEDAAELLHLSVESIKAYETGQRVPPNATVAAMAELYGTDWLRLEHLAMTAEELCVLPQICAQPFVVAVIQLVGRVSRLPLDQLLRIAEDGVIDEAERPDYDRILPEVDGVAAAALQLKCCEDAKKERPEAATSKRSVSANRENHCINSIPQIRGNARKICAGRGVPSR